MNTLTGKPWLLGCAVLCAAVAAMHQPRPAIGAFITATVFAIGSARRLALLACLIVAAGLIAATPPHHQQSPRASLEAR